jgi:hypothetical protein
MSQFETPWRTVEHLKEEARSNGLLGKAKVVLNPISATKNSLKLLNPANVFKLGKKLFRKKKKR